MLIILRNRNKTSVAELSGIFVKNEFRNVVRDKGLLSVRFRM